MIDDLRRSRLPWVVLPLVAMLAGMLVWAIASLPLESAGLGPLAREHLPDSGVGNPVTAVLLNFRGYDTLLELAVLLLALLGVWSVSGVAAPDKREAAPAVLLAFVRLLLPVLVLVAGYLLWRGADAPGGAFQAGAMLGAGGVLARLVGASVLPPRPWLTRTLLGLGFFVFLTLAIGLMVVGGTFLQYGPARAGALILLIESAATVSIGLTLVALFVGGTPAGRHSADADAPGR